MVHQSGSDKRTMRKLAITAIALTVLMVVLFAAYSAVFDRSPPHGMIDQSYYCCEKCRSLRGGIWGTGPLKILNGSNSRFCIHEWKEINKEQFKQRATDWHGTDWAAEGWFWNDGREEVKESAR
jgi:hypothetical protein